METIDSFTPTAAETPTPPAIEGVAALLADGLGALLVGLVVLVGLMVLAHLQAELVGVLRALLALVSSPFGLAAQALARLAGQLAAHRDAMLAHLAERHGGTTVWALIGSLLAFLAVLVLTAADFRLVVLRVSALLGLDDGAPLAEGELNILFGLVFATLAVVLAMPLLDEIGVTHLTPYGHAQGRARRVCRYLALGCFGLLVLAYALLATQSQLVVVQPPAAGVSATDAAAWDPNASNPLERVEAWSAATTAPTARNPLLDGMGVLIMLLTFALVVLALALGSWSLAQGPLALYVIALTALALPLRLLGGLAGLIVYLLEALYGLLAVLLAPPAKLGRTLWNQLARYPRVQAALRRSQEEMTLVPPPPATLLAEDRGPTLGPVARREADDSGASRDARPDNGHAPGVSSATRPLVSTPPPAL